MLDDDSIISLAYKRGFRKDAVKTLLNFYRNRNIDIENLIINNIDDNIFDYLFLNMEHINPVIYGKRYIDKIKEYNDDYFAIKILKMIEVDLSKL
jgi:hypothetical protein